MPEETKVAPPQGFIKLSDRRSSVFISSRHIHAVSVQGDNSQIITEGGAAIRVDQTPDQIFKAMADAATPAKADAKEAK